MTVAPSEFDTFCRFAFAFLGAHLPERLKAFSFRLATVRLRVLDHGAVFYQPRPLTNRLRHGVGVLLDSTPPHGWIDGRCQLFDTASRKHWR